MSLPSFALAPDPERFVFRVYTRLILGLLLLFNSRQSIKKYVQANNKITVASQNAFDAQFNKAIKAGVEKGEFTQPKGMYTGVALLFVPLIRCPDPWP